MITEIERKIYERINYSDKYIRIKQKYIDNGVDTPTFRVPEVKKIFKKLEFFSYKYLGEGGHKVTKKIKDFDVTYKFDISRNNMLIYIYISIEGKYIGPSESLMGMVLRYIPYDKQKIEEINKSFGLNTIEDMENYIHDFIGLCDEFVDEYIKEIEAGNITVKSK